LSEIDYEELAKKLDKLYSEKPELLFKLYNKLRKYFITNEDFRQFLEQMSQENKAFREQMSQENKKFREQMSQENKKFREQMTFQFQELIKEIDKRFEENRKETNKRFEEINKRFEENRVYMDRRFRELAAGYGGTFEGFNKAILRKILKERGIPIRAFNATPIHFDDPSRFVHIKTTNVEINIFSEDPPIIGEVTSSLAKISELEIFIRKIKFIKEKFRKNFKKFFITLYIDDDIKDEAKKLFKTHEIEAITME